MFILLCAHCAITLVVFMLSKRWFIRGYMVFSEVFGFWFALCFPLLRSCAHLPCISHVSPAPCVIPTSRLPSLPAFVCSHPFLVVINISVYHLFMKHTYLLFVRPRAMLLTLNHASITLAFWLIDELGGLEISPFAKSYLRFFLLTGVVNSISIAWEPYIL